MYKGNHNRYTQETIRSLFAIIKLVMELKLRKATQSDLAEVNSWLESDTGPQEFVGAYEPTQQIINVENINTGWVALWKDDLVAFASLVESPANQANIGFIVKPTRRREGIAETFVPMLLERNEIHAFSKIVGTPHLEDTAAQKILQRSGFHQIGYDENGLVIFERR